MGEPSVPEVEEAVRRVVVPLQQTMVALQRAVTALTAKLDELAGAAMADRASMQERFDQQLVAMQEQVATVGLIARTTYRDLAEHGASPHPAPEPTRPPRPRVRAPAALVAALAAPVGSGDRPISLRLPSGREIIPNITPDPDADPDEAYLLILRAYGEEFPHEPPAPAAPGEVAAHGPQQPLGRPGDGAAGDPGQ